MDKHVLVVLSDGFEDIEAVAPIDILNRAGVKVTVASLNPGPVQAAYGTTIIPHTTVDEVTERVFDGIVLPGGARNAESLAANRQVIDLIHRHCESGKLVAAICASPGLVLAEAAGVLGGRRASSAKGFESKLTAHGATCTGLPVTCDGNFVTASGPGAALLFGLQLVEYLIGKHAADELAVRWQIVRQPGQR
jgi:4-methyl-5(b-hydroxyethyl)-thiazole monophosphate biosynthesis